MRLEILTGSGCCCYYPSLLHQVFGYQCCEYYYYAELTEVVHGAHLEYLEAVKNKNVSDGCSCLVSNFFNSSNAEGFFEFHKLFEVEHSIHYTRLQQKIEKARFRN